MIFYVTFNSGTPYVDRYLELEAETVQEIWDRLNPLFGRTYTVWSVRGWTNWQGLTVAQRAKLTRLEISDARPFSDQLGHPVRDRGTQ